jgi:glycosyltransferase involved in cell wall biosynthesis
VLIEAMALGKAVIGSRAGAIPEVVRDGENGRLVDPGDSRALARVIAELGGDPGLRARLGASARQTALAMTGELESAQWLGVYAAACGQRVQE